MKPSQATLWLTDARFAPYLGAAEGDHERAVSLYVWNARISAALQSSHDHNKSFTPRVRLSDAPFASRVGLGSERELPDIGSRLASLSTEDRSFAVWTDTRNGTKISGKQDLMRAVAAFSDPARLEPWEENALRYGGIALMILGLALAGWEAVRALSKA